MNGRICVTVVQQLSSTADCNLLKLSRVVIAYIGVTYHTVKLKPDWKFDYVQVVHMCPVTKYM